MNSSFSQTILLQIEMGEKTTLTLMTDEHNWEFNQLIVDN